ncbi:hypothetical protein ACCQ12_17860 [Xanthomonas sp. NCPPB 1068]|uniref:hypothetical protein n=1 Tax=Xanthomonas sp. NCPPB 1068 TaxID=487525 RepID=UPI0035567894
MNEHPASFDQGNPGTMEEFAAARSRCTRLWLLRILDASPSRCGNDDIMHAGLSHVGLPMAHDELLTHLHYLAEKDLVQLEYVDDFSFKVWVIKLTRKGHDVVNDLIVMEGI